jgi:hypothetical protein
MLSKMCQTTHQTDPSILFHIVFFVCAHIDDQRRGGALRGLHPWRYCRRHNSPSADHGAAPASVSRQTNGFEHEGSSACRNIDVAAEMGADGDEYRIKPAGCALLQDIVDAVIKADPYAHRVDPPNFPHQRLAGQPIGRMARCIMPPGTVPAS